MSNVVNAIALGLVAGGLFAIVGALFGAVAGGLARINGQGAGGYLGNALADFLGRLHDKKASPLATGAIIGAADGAAFLGVLGFIGGVLLRARDPELRVERLAVPLVAVLSLAIAACLLGALAYVLIGGGIWSVGVLFGLVAGTLIGTISGPALALEHCPIWGGALGTILGLLAAVGARSPREKGQVSPVGEQPPAPSDGSSAR